jgi:hypothetical protein
MIRLGAKIQTLWKNFLKISTKKDKNET